MSKYNISLEQLQNTETLSMILYWTAEFREPPTLAWMPKQPHLQQYQPLDKPHSNHIPAAVSTFLSEVQDQH